MAGENVILWGWDADNEKYVKVLVNAAGKLIIDPTEILEDTPTDGEVGKAPTSNWAYDHEHGTLKHFVPTAFTEVYRVSNVSTGPRTALVSSVAGDELTFTTNFSVRIIHFGHTVDNNAYHLIWNTTKTQSAWVCAYVDTDTVQVTNAADIADWELNDVVTTAYDGVGGSEYSEIDLTPTIGSEATGVVLAVYIQDTGVLTAFRGCYIREDEDGTDIATYMIAQNMPNRVQFIIPVDASQHFQVRPRAVGVDTLAVTIVTTGYFK